jgi:DNA repair exonuclease SbcCD ATPase subunit
MSDELIERYGERKETKARLRGSIEALRYDVNRHDAQIRADREFVGTQIQGLEERLGLMEDAWQLKAFDRGDYPFRGRVLELEAENEMLRSSRDRVEAQYDAVQSQFEARVKVLEDAIRAHKEVALETMLPPRVGDIALWDVLNDAS